ncbi:OadG family protein [Endozoicomonas sp. SM1973]|uniref:Probable oxaloacetate decarboxylase gamma chain n=1 Tax=Spartinivicinus marinus TaxID=2994442 RepID=A0A853I7T6_9GAMM|nr:OadG family protein [Spartinivicinus marinus]MCX4025250.1 OadG family protein [Spartinivicinus marinus]NYZ65971.1 OadG family protein [Spartinivicinus marinus]
MSELLNEGLNLMLFGMGFVFLFLTLLVFATGLMSRLITKYSNEEIPSVSQPAASATVVATQQDEQLVAVISAAIKQYRSRHR